jgi:hypothetical protein
MLTWSNQPLGPPPPMVVLVQKAINLAPRPWPCGKMAARTGDQAGG